MPPEKLPAVLTTCCPRPRLTWRLLPKGQVRQVASVFPCARDPSPEPRSLMLSRGDRAVLTTSRWQRLSRPWTETWTPGHGRAVARTVLRIPKPRGPAPPAACPDTVPRGPCCVASPPARRLAYGTARPSPHGPEPHMPVSTHCGPTGPATGSWSRSHALQVPFVGTKLRKPENGGNPLLFVAEIITDDGEAGKPTLSPSVPAELRHGPRVSLGTHPRLQWRAGRCAACGWEAFLKRLR